MNKDRGFFIFILNVTETWQIRPWNVYIHINMRSEFNKEQQCE